jgi:surfactin family lipopeptide synthetase B
LFLENLKPCTGLLTVGDITLSPESIRRETHALAGGISRLVPNPLDKTYVAVIVDGSLESHLTILALEIANLDCAVIDSKTPSDLMKKMIDSLRANTILVATDSDERDYSELGPRRFLTKTLRIAESDAWEKRHTRDGTLVVFSSGSTGTPKGVKIAWSLIRKSRHIRQASTGVSVSGTTRIMNFSSVSYLYGILNLQSLHSGASVTTIDPLSLTPRELFEQILRIQPTELFLTAHLAEGLARAADDTFDLQISSVQVLTIGSGSTSWETINKLKSMLPEDGIFITSYSATEALRVFTHKVPLRELPMSGTIPIGIPREKDNVRFKASDIDGLQEVLVAGDISHGYIDEAQTTAKFQTDDDGKLWWLSGDLVEQDPQTGLYYHRGRADDFVKINDFNVSTTDVEIRVKQASAAEESAVVVVDSSGRKRLVAFAVHSTQNQEDQPAILRKLREDLPKYSLPHAIIKIDALPKTRSGKVDKAALLALAVDYLNGK